MINMGDMLTYRRAHDSLGEAQFIARYIAPVAAPVLASDGTIHAYTVRIGNARGAFCAHTDTVHNRQNPEPRQAIAFDSAMNEYIVGDAAQRDCLGADNAAGCYVLLKMIAANVPGLYLFFRGEERGGIGSGYMSENCADFFAGLDYAIGFDRKGTSSIITEMMVGKTCSDAFAESLADALGMGHKPDNTGSFTDTANLAGIIPECTNVSCGYASEHGPHESLDVEYLDALADACIAFFSTGEPLVIEREPGDFASASWGWRYPSSNASNDYDALEKMDDDEIDYLARYGSEDELRAILKSARDDLIFYSGEFGWK